MSVPKLILLCGLLLAGSCFAESTKRTALVIGNARYEQDAGPLRNTVNDAKAVAKTLRSLGFEVIERHDLSRDQFLSAVEDFRKTLSGAEVAVLFYAGHGISVNGANYLVPVKSGFPPGGAADEVALRMLAETRLFNAAQAVADMSEAGSRCNLVILDACRNTPLLPSKTRSFAGGGLAEMNPPAGSLIAFSTDAGRTALDGDGANGLYTSELLKNMATPGLTIEQVFKRTRAGVLARSEGSQVPAEYSRLVGDDIYLAGRSTPVAEAAPTKAEPPAISEIQKLAASGKSAECVTALQEIAAARGPGDYAVQPLDTLLERVKIDLARSTAASPRVTDAEATCALVLRVLPECLPLDHPMAASLFVKASNRRGDALLLLGRPQDALNEFDAAIGLAPCDAYIFYNRGRAHLALGDTEKARADFTEAVSAKYDQPGARKLALAALEKLD